MVYDAPIVVVNKLVGPEAAATKEVPVVKVGSKTKVTAAVPAAIVRKVMVASVPRVVVPVAPKLPESNRISPLVQSVEVPMVLVKGSMVNIGPLTTETAVSLVLSKSTMAEAAEIASVAGSTMTSTLKFAPKA